MGIVQAIMAAGKSRLNIHSEIAKFSAGALRLAAALSRNGALDEATKAKAGEARARSAANETPCDLPYGNFRTWGEHAVAASSRDPNLAMLQTIVRWSGAETVLEIGTAYGVSGVALVMAGARLTTIDGFEPMATLGPQNIRAAGLEAECLKGRKEEVIPLLARQGRRFDMIFHDGGHLGDAYVDDFHAMAPMLNPGGVFVVDNVFHDDRPSQREYTRDKSRRTCREAWNEILEDPRVEGALVYRKTVGILLTR